MSESNELPPLPRRFRGHARIITTGDDKNFEQAEVTDDRGDVLLIAASPTVGDYPDSFQRPGTSFVFISTGETIHDGVRVNRESAIEIGRRLIQWAEQGTLKETP